MTELISNWLNNEIELSQAVTDYETDFANGYLFGELLYKFNQQSNFKDFSKKNAIAATIENFKMLQVTLKNLRVKFNSQNIDDIMKCKRGEALRLLYQIKMALEKVYPPTDIAVLRKTGKMGDNQPALKIAHSREQYDAHASQFFQQRLQVLNKPQKTLNMEKHLAKFDEQRVIQEKIAKDFRREEVESKDKVKQEIRRAQINKLQRNAGFMDQWQQKGVEDWQKNQTIKKEREARVLEFEYKQADKFNNLTLKKVDGATQEVYNGIAQFEQTLNAKGIKTRVSKDEAERAVSESLENSPLKQTTKTQRLSQSLYQRQTGATQKDLAGQMGTKFGGAMTLTSTGLKTKDKKTVDEKTRKDRERRRRKMIVDQSKTQIETEQKKKEDQIKDRLKKQSKQEKELDYEQWRTNQCKNVIIENRKLREARYDKRRELDNQNANWREEEMLKQLKGQMDRETEVLNDRDNEMRIMHKQAKREQRTTFGNQLFDAIFDIADEAYNHQQKCDSVEIDQRNWHEWLQLFIEQLPISEPTHNPSLEEELAEGEEQQELVDESSEKLDHLELVDYLQNQGQWPQTLITEYKVNLEAIMTGQTEQPVAGAKGGKAPPTKANAEQLQLEEGDTELPHQAMNNYLLGDAIETVININFEDRLPQKRPKVPHYLNLKLSLVGLSFAGKKTQAQKLKEQYGIEVLQISDLVQEAIEFTEQVNSQQQQEIQYFNIENNDPDPDQQNGWNQDYQDENQIQQELADQDNIQNEGEQVVADQILDSSEINEEYITNMDLSTCLQVKELLLSGREITDDLYVQLIINRLRRTFPYKNKAIIEEELKQKVERQIEIETKIDELEREIAGEVVYDGHKRRKKRDPTVIEHELGLLRKEFDKIIQVDKNGYVLVDFPTNFAQAKLLETALSGHLPKIECDPIIREDEISEANLLVKPTDKIEPPVELIKSGIDAVLWLNADRQECQRRAIGRRFDHVNEKMYHIENEPPLTTNAPLCERLIPIDDESNPEDTLIDKWISFDAHAPALQTWLSQFGDSQIERQILNTIDANLSEEETFEQIQNVIQGLLDIKQTQEQEIKYRIRQQIEAEKEAILQKQREEEEKIIAQQEYEKLTEPEKKALALEEEKKAQAPKVTRPEGVNERIPQKLPSVENIDNDFKPKLLKQWKDVSSNYKNQTKKCFRQVRSQRERMIQKFSLLQKSFLQFLHRPDQKQEKLEHFIQEFNNFSDQYPDLREDQGTKDELHQRVDILSDEMWEVVEERKDQAVEERKKVMENGWVEFELGFMVACAQQIMQSEVDRFKGSIQVIHDYYHAFEDKLIPEAPPLPTIELVAEGEELPPVEHIPEGADIFNSELYTYPRLDKIFERALRAQVVPDVTQIQLNEKDKKGAPVKKDPRKPQIAEEEKVEESMYVKDMKKAIKLEKAILRYRLVQLRNWCLKRLKEMRSKAIKVYQKLEDWILVSSKAENMAVDEMCVVIKKAIEEEEKIQDELRIKFMDFCVDEKIMNYIVPPPEKLPQMEQVRGDRFNIKQLTQLVTDLETISAQQGHQSLIPNKVIVDLFVRKLENSRTLGDENGLPEDWKKFREYDFQTMVRNLDRHGSGHISWKQLATMICLIKSAVASDKEAEGYHHELQKSGVKEGSIEEADFIQTRAYFDQSEASKDREYSIAFPRTQLIKELIFRINKEEVHGHTKLNCKKLLSILKAKEIILNKKGVLVGGCFGDLLFASIDK